MEISKELLNSLCEESKKANYSYTDKDIESMAKLILTYLFDFKNITEYRKFRNELGSLLIRVERRHNGLVILNDLAEAKMPMDNILFKELMSHSQNFDENLLCFVGNSFLVRVPSVYILKDNFFNENGEKK
jgi:hypothetical protein